MQRSSPNRRRVIAIALTRSAPVVPTSANDWILAGAGLTLLLAALLS